MGQIRKSSEGSISGLIQVTVLSNYSVRQRNSKISQVSLIFYETKSKLRHLRNILGHKYLVIQLDHIKMDLMELNFKNMNSVALDQYHVQWQVLVPAVLKFINLSKRQNPMPTKLLLNLGLSQNQLHISSVTRVVNLKTWKHFFFNLIFNFYLQG
jgi:hypothetical protein